MPPLKVWRARWFASINFAGSYSIGKARPGALPHGSMTLNFRLLDAGIHTGRDVDVEVLPEQLETLASMVRRAIAIRDGREA